MKGVEGVSEFALALRERLNNNQPLVVYHKPGDKVIRAWFPDEVELNPEEHEVSPGFVFSPFDHRSPTALFPLHASEIRETSVEGIHHLRNDENSPGLLNRRVQTGPEKEREPDLYHSSKIGHQDLVSKTIRFIQSGQATKIVISRKEKINVEHLDPIGVFGTLVEKYPEAFAYLWYHPGIGIWTGASPEMLLSIQEGDFRTMSLAATRLWNEEQQPAWEEKELEEQRLVTQMIEKELGDQLIGVGEPFNQRAGHLVHLRTDIEGHIKPGSHPRDIIRKLHPTAAICGMPRERAREFLLENEGYSREYYTGYLGELMGPDNRDTNLFVNLRCMKLTPEENSAWIFVGGGITRASQVDKEWEETVVKSQTMKGIFLEK
jgi:isochorismate synthase